MSELINTKSNISESSQSEQNSESASRRKFSKVLKNLWNAFLKTLFPPKVACDSCGLELVADTRYNLCSSCIEKLPFNNGKVCAVCGTPIDDEADYCIRCQNTESSFEKNRSPLVYQAETAKLILSLKFGGKKYLVDTLSALMADTFIDNRLIADVLVYVPMTNLERKKRGFNQSELLAVEIGKRLEIPVCKGLLKVKETSLQKELSAKERAENLAGAFLAVPEFVKGQSIVLIDDVFTTGSTANECAKALLKARAKRVNVLTAAVTKQRIFME
ncbi:MAG: ComF family protein [Clostridia bacterium]|nr:ComF family protein [Clostridia bacterium]